MNNKKTKIVNVNVATYKGAKQAAKYFASGNRYESASYYHKKKLKAFLQAFNKSNKTTKEKNELTKSFAKYLGFNKGGISKSRNKGTLRFQKVGEKQLKTIAINKDKRKRIATKSSNISDAGYANFVMSLYNAWTFWADFYSDIYPDWVERVKDKIGTIVLPNGIEIDAQSISNNQFLMLMQEFKNKGLGMSYVFNPDVARKDLTQKDIIGYMNIKKGK